jgi:hypothetical protein
MPDPSGLPPIPVPTPNFAEVQKVSAFVFNKEKFKSFFWRINKRHFVITKCKKFAFHLRTPLLLG